MPPSGSEIQGDEQVGPRLVAGDDLGSGESQLREQVRTSAAAARSSPGGLGLGTPTSSRAISRTSGPGWSRHLYRAAQSTPCQVSAPSPVPVGTASGACPGWAPRYFGRFSPKYLVLMRSAIGHLLAADVRLLYHVGGALRDDFLEALRLRRRSSRTESRSPDSGARRGLLAGNYPERRTIPLVPTGHHVWPAFVIEAGQAGEVRLSEEAEISASSKRPTRPRQLSSLIASPFGSPGGDRT